VRTKTRECRSPRARRPSELGETRSARRNAAIVPPQLAGRLPTMTFGQLRMLARAGTALRPTIRHTAGGYVVEVDVGPRRWMLVSTHGKHPRHFHHLDGAANAVRALGACEAIVRFREGDAT
jgi:hypothetical protein